MIKFYTAKDSSGFNVALVAHDDEVVKHVITDGHNKPDDYWVGHLNFLSASELRAERSRFEAAVKRLQGENATLPVYRLSDFQLTKEIGTYL